MQFSSPGPLWGDRLAPEKQDCPAPPILTYLALSDVFRAFPQLESWRDRPLQGGRETSKGIFFFDLSLM